MTRFPFGTRIVIHRRTQTGRDEYGAPEYRYDDLIVSGCALGPSTGTEQDTGASDTDTQRVALYCPPATDLRVTDEVTVMGRRYRVDGRPADYARSPFTGTPGPVVANLTLAA